MTTTAKTFKNGAEQWPVGELWVDTVGVRPVEIDWQERWGDGDGWESFEAPECPECGEYGYYDRDEYAWKCGNSSCDNRDEIEVEDGGPMMNYFYPLPDLNRLGDDANEAATRIADLPLCVVRFEDGSYALALTGGGMDLSWEIAEAFTRLGFLPPVHFCDLPRLAGKQIVGDAAYTLEACKRSCDVAEHQARSTRDRLDAFDA